MTATLTRVPLCTLDDLPVGLGRAFEVGGRPLAVFRTRGGEVFAVSGLCPHKNGPLADGMLIGTQVVCPLHAYRYQGETGCTILLASHNMAEVERMCDDVILMQRGRVFDQGSPKQLIERFDRSSMEEVFLDMARGRERRLDDLRRVS